MEVRKIRIGGIPAILWGKESDKTIIAVHGSHSSKIDDCIWILAEEAARRGWQTLSFDLPQHGERVYETAPCMAEQCVRELREIMAYARKQAEQISVFGCSMGAYFSLLAYAGEEMEKAFFLSPVTDMERVIRNIMRACNVSEEELRERQVVENPIETLYWEYYMYVKEHPIEKWPHRTEILRGETDTLCEKEVMEAFAARFGCGLEEQPGGEHWFHTDGELAYFRDWLARVWNRQDKEGKHGGL